MVQPGRQERRPGAQRGMPVRAPVLESRQHPVHPGDHPGLAGEENLREVVLFPMNQRAEDLLMGAPSEVTQKQLRELHIRLNLPAKGQ